MIRLSFCSLFVWLSCAIAQPAVIFTEGFEYGSNACGSSLFSLGGFTTIWNGDQGNMPHGTATACVNTDQAHGGSRSIRWEFPNDDGSNCFLEANHSYGPDVWIEFWIRPAREGSYVSSTTDANDGKLIYAYISSVGASIWALQQSVDNYGTLTCDNTDYSSNTIADEGMSLIYTGPGAATARSGYNLSAELLAWNAWNHVILHARYDGANDSFTELWIDNGGGLVKAWQHDLSGECDWDAGGTTCGRLKFGLMNTQAPGYYYFDDITVGTSEADMTWSARRRRRHMEKR